MQTGSLACLEAAEFRNIDLLINRIRPDMVRRGEMMSVEDVVEILAVNLIGAVPDDEEVVIFDKSGRTAGRRRYAGGSGIFQCVPQDTR